MLRLATRPVTLQLERGELRRLQPGLVQLRVVSGLAWVTRPNDPHDHFLSAGQALPLRDGLVGAETALQLCIEPLVEPQPRGRTGRAPRLPALSRWFHALGSAFASPRPEALRKEPT